MREDDGRKVSHKTLEEMRLRAVRLHPQCLASSREQGLLLATIIRRDGAQ